MTRYGLDYDEERFPTEVHHGHRLTYDKCYVGQEVLARMRTYGHANRRVFHLTTQDGVSLPLGAVVRSGENEAGTVSSSCFSWRRASPLGIAMVKRKYWDSGELSIEGGSVVVLEELPEPTG